MWETWFVAYLWGIETLSDVVSARMMPGVCSLPMRNWNTDRISIPQGMTGVCSLPMRNWNWLRWAGHSQLFEFVAYLWGIETILTYGDSEFKGLVCSLPMRNWNQSPGRIYEFVVWFVAYLWGIETSEAVLPVQRRRVCSLPMRNWNRRRGHTLKE